MSVVKLTKSYLDPFAISDIYEDCSVEEIEIPIDYKTWIKVYKGIKKCRVCHKELNNWEKSINIQWHYDNKKKGRISYRCYGCANND